jgi:GntR family transcriptional regulator
METAKWSIDFSSGVHVYKQIINYIYAAIGNGELKVNDKLPTIKELAEQLKVNPNTVAKAYRELELKGVIAGKRGNGSFVSKPATKSIKLTVKDKHTMLHKLLGRVFAEAKIEGIMEEELIDYIIDRRKGYGKA